MGAICLGKHLCLNQFIDIVRRHAKVEFSATYRNRVNASRALVEKWVDEEKVMYGVTTGFGALCTKAIDKKETAQLQTNIILSHSTSVGAPFQKKWYGARCL